MTERESGPRDRDCERKTRERKRKREREADRQTELVFNAQSNRKVISG